MRTTRHDTARHDTTRHTGIAAPRTNVDGRPVEEPVLHNVSWANRIGSFGVVRHCLEWVQPRLARDGIEMDDRHGRSSSVRVAPPPQVNDDDDDNDNNDDHCDHCENRLFVRHLYATLFVSFLSALAFCLSSIPTATTTTVTTTIVITTVITSNASCATKPTHTHTHDVIAHVRTSSHQETSFVRITSAAAAAGGRQQQQQQQRRRRRRSIVATHGCGPSIASSQTRELASAKPRPRGAGEHGTTLVLVAREWPVRQCQC